MKKSKNKKGFGKFLAGASVGAALGLLFASKKGVDTRADLKKMFSELKVKIEGLDADEVKETVENKIEELQMGLENLDKEQVLKEAKKQAKKLQDAANELVDYAVEKGTPIIEKSTQAIKLKITETCEEVIKKLS